MSATSPTTGSRPSLPAAFGLGVLFALGLALGGMTRPGKVIAFFDFSRGFESWDPSLGLVMGGAIAIYLPVYRFVRARTGTEGLPPTSGVDARLLAGAALFGIGWGLAGYCPGPAIVALGASPLDVVVFVLAMFVGMGAFHGVGRRR